VRVGFTVSPQVETQRVLFGYSVTCLASLISAIPNTLPKNRNNHIYQTNIATNVLNLVTPYEKTIMKESSLCLYIEIL